MQQTPVDSIGYSKLTHGAAMKTEDSDPQGSYQQEPITTRRSPDVDSPNQGMANKENTDNRQQPDYELYETEDENLTPHMYT